MKTYLSVAEIAQITSKEKSTVLRWIQSGKLKPVRMVGNEYQVPHKTFEKWWAENVRTIDQEKGQV